MIADGINAENWGGDLTITTGANTTVPQGPPAFRTIAGHMDPGQLRAFLSHPHGAMPDLALTRAEINDLIDYIETLK